MCFKCPPETSTISLLTDVRLQLAIVSHCSVPYMVQSGVNYLESVRRETEVLDIWDFRNLVLWAAQGGIRYSVACFHVCRVSI